MIMTPSAGHGQSHQSARHHVNLIINYIMRVAVLHADREKTQRGQCWIIRTQPQLIGSKLLNDEAIVRLNAIPALVLDLGALRWLMDAPNQHFGND